MKKTMMPVLCLLAITGSMACKKDQADAGNVNTSTLAASRTTAIGKGEPVQFSLNNVSDTVHWSVTPAGHVQIRSQGNRASLLFDQAGTYEVRAQSGNVQATSRVSVSSSIYIPVAAGAARLPLTGDQVRLTVSRIDSGSVSGLLISAVTTRTYNCLNSYLGSTLTTAGNDYAIDFPGVDVPDGSNCTAGQAQASSFSYLYPVADGSHVLKMTLNGTTYTGSFIKKDRSYTISWPYSSGITVSPLEIK